MPKSGHYKSGQKPKGGGKSVLGGLFSGATPAKKQTSQTHDTNRKNYRGGQRGAPRGRR